MQDVLDVPIVESEAKVDELPYVKVLELVNEVASYYWHAVASENLSDYWTDKNWLEIKRRLHPGS